MRRQTGIVWQCCQFGGFYLSSFFIYLKNHTFTLSFARKQEKSPRKAITKENIAFLVVSFFTLTILIFCADSDATMFLFPLLFFFASVLDSLIASLFENMTVMVVVVSVSEWFYLFAGIFSTAFFKLLLIFTGEGLPLK